MTNWVAKNDKGQWLTGISVVLPAYNEEESIVEALELTVQALEESFADYEVIVVNDASKDDTLRLTTEFAEKHPQVRVIDNEVNLGQGGSLCKAFSAAEKDIISHNGVDLPLDPKDYTKLMPYLEKDDIVVAARTERAGYTFYRTIISVVNLVMLNVLFGLGLSDYNFVQLYKRQVWEKAKPTTRSTGFFYPEVIIRAHDAGFTIREIPITYQARQKGVATAGNPRVVLSSLRDLLSFWLLRLFGKQNAGS